MSMVKENCDRTHRPGDIDKTKLPRAHDSRRRHLDVPQRCVLKVLGLDSEVQFLSLGVWFKWFRGFG